MNTTMNIQQPTPSGITSWEIIVLVGTLILSIVQFYHLYLKQKSETPSQEKIKDFFNSPLFNDEALNSRLKKTRIIQREKRNNSFT